MKMNDLQERNIDNGNSLSSFVKTFTVFLFL